VLNRVEKIKAVLGLKFRWVPSADNPADVGSRGIAARDLALTLWWTGPQWLYRPSTEWPSSPLVAATQQELDALMTRRVFWTLRVALQEHATAHHLLPYGAWRFFDEATSRRQMRKNQSLKKRQYVFYTLPNSQDFELRIPDEIADQPVKDDQQLQMEPHKPRFAIFLKSLTQYPFDFKLENFSSLKRLVWRLVHCTKAITLLPKYFPKMQPLPVIDHIPDNITFSEAILHLIYEEQRIYFPEIIRMLTSENSPEFVVFQKFHFIIDKDGLIRLRSYLPDNAFIKDVASPLLLHSKSYLLRLILLRGKITCTNKL